MEISFTPEIEEKLRWMAAQTGRGLEEVVRELVARYPDHGDGMGQAADKGLAWFDRDESVAPDDVRLQALERSFKELQFRMGPKTWKRERPARALVTALMRLERIRHSIVCAGRGWNLLTGKSLLFPLQSLAL